MQPTHQLGRIPNLITKRLTLNIPLKIAEDIEAAVQFFNDTIQWAGWNTTPEPANSNNSSTITKTITFEPSSKA
jgi:hypothetical protein